MLLRSQLLPLLMLRTRGPAWLREYDVAATSTSLEQHGWDIHALRSETKAPASPPGSRALTCQAAGTRGQFRPAGELSLLFSAAACGLGLYARANQAPTAKTMPTTSDPVAFSG